MASGAGTTRAKLTHDTGQALGPVTGSKGFSGMGHTHDEQFFAGRGDHQISRQKLLSIPGSPEPEQERACDPDGLWKNELSEPHSSHFHGKNGLKSLQIKLSQLSKDCSHVLRVNSSSYIRAEHPHAAYPRPAHGCDA